jgi:hypothetical protein
MKNFATAWPGAAIVQEVLAQIPWEKVQPVVAQFWDL